MRALVAIDGPAGVGKSTLSERLAEAIGLPYVNTGSMYRAVAAAALEQGVSVDDGPALAELGRRLRFSLGGGVPPSLRIDGAAPWPALVSEEVDETVSRVSSHPEVRRVLREEQRRLGRGGAVMEGRDIGSVVFPEADVKIFLQAAPGERAARRIRERGGEPAEETDLAGALHARDALDSTVNPLAPAPDAALLDTSGRTADEVFEAVVEIVRSRLGDGP